MEGAALFVQPPHLTQTGTAATLLKQQQHQQTGGQSIEQHVPNVNPAYNHPKLTAIMAHLEYEFNEYKYTVYRCACKSVTLQKVFFTSNIPFKLVLAVMERHGLKDAEGNLMVPPFQLTSLIHDIYFAFERLGHFSKTPSYDLETATAVLSNFFWNIFDPHRRHSISLLEIKVTFLLLCKLYSSDQLVTEFYNVFAGKKTKCVSKFNFEYFLSILTKIFTYIGEGNAYGSHNVQTVMEQCFTRCHNPIGLTEYQFHCLWTTTQTRFLIYANLIALIKRIEDTEKLIHNNVCASCHSERIIGIRFKCQSCKNLSLCLKCFASGYSTNKHESGHRMFECFTEDLPPKKFTHYFAKICTIFCHGKGNSNEEETKGFCNINESCTINETELVTIGTHRSSNASTVSAGTATAANNSKIPKVQSPIQNNIRESIEPSLIGLTATASNASNVSGRLQSLIDRLLLQNSKLEQQLKCVQTSTPEEIQMFLKSHQKFLLDIIKEMRNFGDESQSVSTYPTSSTPNRSIFAKQGPILDNFNGPQSNSSNLSNSMNGADINRSYLDANKSDYSINDLSLWFNQKKHPSLSPSSNHQNSRNLCILAEVTNAVEQAHAAASIIDTEMRDTEMLNFKLLLNKVKEIVEDSYSDNTELSEATQNLENVLDNIIKTEEQSRRQSEVENL